ncbi:hypothetical protein [Agaribacter flavus]|uniref:ATPase n=1 Tax=Agaribacter flavus TaxID=1902781 RepID=A0ABV7FIF1_9ALTE
MIENIVIAAGIILILFFYESIKFKGKQSIAERLKLISLQVACTIVITLVTVIFLSEVLKATSDQVELLGALTGAVAYLLCAYIFRRR